MSYRFLAGKSQGKAETSDPDCGVAAAMRLKLDVTPDLVAQMAAEIAAGDAARNAADADGGTLRSKIDFCPNTRRDQIYCKEPDAMFASS